MICFSIVQMCNKKIVASLTRLTLKPSPLVSISSALEVYTGRTDNGHIIKAILALKNVI